MDKTVMIVGAIAILAILAFTLIMNPFAGPATSSEATDTAGDDSSSADQQTTEEAPEEDKEPTHRPSTEDDIDYVDATYGVVIEEVEGNCILYQNLVSDRYECFGTAGAYETIPNNDYRPATAEKYFCKATEYGCKLYEKVDHAIWVE